MFVIFHGKSQLIGCFGEKMEVNVVFVHRFSSVDVAVICERLFKSLKKDKLNI
jgi:predicted GIY-YIG superfamily endonuclease